MRLLIRTIEDGIMTCREYILGRATGLEQYDTCRARQYLNRMNKESRLTLRDLFRPSRSVE
jgi:hypothetical protein